MYVFAGLGNPGARYVNNRHNVGYLIAEHIVQLNNMGAFRRRSKFLGEVSEGDIDNKRVLVLKPNTFVNDSGRSIGAVLRYYNITPARLYVLHDDLDLSFGKIRVKFGGGHAGHNGLKSVSSHIGCDYWRLRVGIGHPGPGRKDLVMPYVLQDFNKPEFAWLETLFKAIGESVALLLLAETSNFMNRIVSLAPPSTTSDI